MAVQRGETAGGKSIYPSGAPLMTPSRRLRLAASLPQGEGRKLFLGWMESWGGVGVGVGVEVRAGSAAVTPHTAFSGQGLHF